MFIPIQYWWFIEDEEGEEDCELRETDINPQYIESIEHELSFGDHTFITMASGNGYTVNMPKEEFMKVLEAAQLKIFLS
jgi:uncharacterized protein YlzI (FlbEa/FlbD family)